METPEAIAWVDGLFASIGLEHGRRSTRSGTWADGFRVKPPKSSPGKLPVSRKAPGIERVPGWEKYSWLNAGFSTRLNGASTIYNYDDRGELNLGWNGEDSVEAVAENRRRFVKAIGGKQAGELVTIRQTHTPIVQVIGAEHTALCTAEGKAVLRGDAMVTRQKGLLLGVQTADCVPVLIADTKKRVVAAFHAGWRGTLARIVERGVGTMRLQFGSRPQDLVAAIGPSIGSCCYSVGEEVKFEFDSQFAYAPKLFSEVYDSDPVRDKYPLLFLTARAPGHSPIGPQIHLDLQEANRRQLLDAGLSAKKITVMGECTACTRLPNGNRKYFSHRGESGFTGRMLSVIGVQQD
ncbi:MAG: peptidoglycan editing factor PgeF [Acidobacteriaceae bacterium]|nr:peptidoglycan editing factor PgeF [Acidobacteriaceae bacterium]